MRGREETTRKIESLIKKAIKDQPDILLDYFYSMNDKTASTKNAYIRHVRNYFDYCNKKNLNYIRASLHDINKYAESIKYNKAGEEISTSLQAARLYAIKHFYEFLIDSGLLKENPCNRLRIPKINEDKPVVSLSIDEVKLLKEKVKTVGCNSDKWRSRDMAIISLGCNTGLRVTSITEINISDVDFDNNSIIVTEKGNKTRAVYFGNNVKADILKWIDYRKEIMHNIDCDALFVSQRKKRISTKAIEDMIKKYTADFDKHITPHKMRSTCATNLYEKTHDIYMVQAVLGHKNIANTRRYANVSVKERRNAAEILDAI